jgi:hypothetical protein
VAWGPAPPVPGQLCMEEQPHRGLELTSGSMGELFCPLYAVVRSAGPST